MRDKRFQINLYQFNDGDAMARHAERMHERGWHLEKVSNWGWTYRRGEPERAQYAVTYFPAASVYDAAPTEEQMTYAEYCESSGWEFVGSYGPVQYFRSREGNPIPIETDERAKLRTIHRSMLKTYVLSYGLLTLSMLISLESRWNSVRYNALSNIRNGTAVWLTGLLLVLLLFLLVMLGDYFLWYICSRWSVAHGGTCAKNHWRLHLYSACGVLAASAVGLTGHFASTAGASGGAVWGFLLIFAGAFGIVAAEQVILALARRGGWDRESTRGVCILAAVVLALVYCGGSALFLPPFMDAHAEDGHVTVPYLYTLPDGENREATLYKDPLPLTLEDLGVALPEDIPYSYHADPDRSPLAWGGTYRQKGAVIRSGQKIPPQLEYSVTVFRWRWLRDLCMETLGNYYRDKDFGYEPADEPAWGAERVYRWGDFQYVLVYPDRVVTLQLDQVALMEERMAVIAEKLGK